MRSELSPQERKLLDHMEKWASVKDAALDAGIDPKYANQLLYRVRQKRSAALGLLRDLARREKKSKLVAKILMERK